MKGILVLGPGRSGTSALTRVINMLGPSVCLPEDRMGPAPANPKGFWESTTITIANELLLQLGGGSWRCPPPVETIRDRASEAVVATLVEAFTTLHPFEEWLCKDPRFSITMPLWKDALDCDPIAVIPVRDPHQVAASYDRSFPTGSVPAAVVWERSMRSGLAHAAGGRAIVAPFDRVLAGLDDWCATTADFLRHHGFEDVAPPQRADVADFVDPDLFHESAVDVTVSDEQLALFDFAVSRAGHHDALEVDGLPPETPSSTEQIDACLRARRGRPFPDPGSAGTLGSGVEGGRIAAIYHVVRAAYEEALTRAS